jgi:hypothetical protein
MVDTVKLTIHCPILFDEKGNKHRPYNALFYDMLLNNTKQNQSGFIMNSVTGQYQRSKESLFIGTSTIYDNYEHMVVNGKIPVPSHNYNMHYRIYDEKIDLEFSIPKFIYGTNVFQLIDHYKRKAQPYEMLVMSIKKVFEDTFFNVKVHWGAIELRRWDYCFNQVFESKYLALKCLHYIKLKHQAKADRLNFEYGFVQLTKSNYLKIYHKGVEFEKHDRLKYTGRYIKQLQDLADRTLRYEKKCSPKNVSYQFNMYFRHNDHPDKALYLKQKNSKKRVDPYLIKEFETIRPFYLGPPIFKGGYQMTPKFFNFLWASFKSDILKKFTVGNMSVDTLRNEAINGTKSSSKRIKILTYIKTFGSLKRAYESGAFTKATYYRYKSELEKENLSETKVPIKIDQDWSNQAYHRFLFAKGVGLVTITKNMSY